MFSKEAIQELAQAEAISAASVVIEQAIKPANANGVAALPDGFSIHDLEDKLYTRRRARGVMSTYVVSDFAAYVAKHSEEGATVFINQDDMTAVAVLNLGTPAEPGHADNRAVLEAKRTAAYSALRLYANGSGRKQSEIAEFFEDWMLHLDFVDADGAKIKPAVAVAAVRKLTIESMRKLESEEKQLSASRSTFESVQATSADVIPTLVFFQCVPYAGLATRTFAMRLSINTGGNAPTIGLRITKQEEHDEEMAKELADLVAVAVTEQPVLIGRYKASA